MSASAEIARVRYLQAMGQPLYVARKPLPGARPSRYLGLRRDAESAATPGDSAPARVRLPAGLRESLGTGAPVSRTVATPPPAMASPSAPDDAAAPGERFSVAAVICARRLCIEDLGGEPLAMEQVQLIAAIGKALDHPDCGTDKPQVVQFDWPLYDNPQLDLGEDEARAALGSFIARQLEEQGCKALLCFGDRVRARLGEASFAVPVVHCPETRSLLADPVLKRGLWQQLGG